MALSLYERTIRQNRRALLALDNRARSDLERAYAQARQQIRADLNRALSQPGEIGPGRQFRIERLGSLERQIDAELVRLTRFTEAVTVNGQRQAVQMGLTQATGLIEAAAPELGASFSRLPVAAFEESIGLLSNGSPLRDLLNDQGLDAGRQARDVLTNAVAQGTGPRQVAKELASILSRSQWRAEQTARNVLLDSHRLASLRTYAANGDILDGWIWTASLSSRTCLACVALHGHAFSLREQFMPRHVACRCSPRPKLKAMFGPMPRLESGDAWLDRQPIETQRTMLPVALFDDYQAGVIRISDFVEPVPSRRWGLSYRESTITEARANSRNRERIAA